MAMSFNLGHSYCINVGYITVSKLGKGSVLWVHTDYSNLDDYCHKLIAVSVGNILLVAIFLWTVKLCLMSLQGILQTVLRARTLQEVVVANCFRHTRQSLRIFM